MLLLLRLPKQLKYLSLHILITFPIELCKYTILKRNASILYHHDSLLQTLKHLLEFLLETFNDIHFPLGIVGLDAYFQVQVLKVLVDVDEEGRH